MEAAEQEQKEATEAFLKRNKIDIKGSKADAEIRLIDIIDISTLRSVKNQADDNFVRRHIPEQDDNLILPAYELPQ